MNKSMREKKRKERKRKEKERKEEKKKERKANPIREELHDIQTSIPNNSIMLTGS